MGPEWALLGLVEPRADEPSLDLRLQRDGLVAFESIAYSLGRLRGTGTGSAAIRTSGALASKPIAASAIWSIALSGWSPRNARVM